jgi:hypothetical protein
MVLKDKAVPDDELMPDWERFYLYRVEEYLVHKYQPDLVEEFRISFTRARARREQYLKQDDTVFSSTEQLLDQIAADLKTHAPWKPKNSTHRPTSPARPGIGSVYQKQFEEL